MSQYIKVLPNVSTPIGATLMKTGQTVSYVTGDDGDLETGREVDFFTLSANNPFGNNKRFTGITGGYQVGGTYYNKDGVSTTSALAIPSDIVIDWSTYSNGTVLGYMRTPHTMPANTFANSINYCNSLSTGGFSIWRNANELELRNIQSRLLTGWFNYNPFNIPSGYFFWTSNTLPEHTSDAIYCNYSNFLFQSFSKSSTVIRPFPVRTFTVTDTTLT